jgi:cysteinyl-tRNA synthetase
MGMTDIDDKIINKAKTDSKHFLEVAKYYEVEFLKDMKEMGVNTPVAITRVSEHIPEIIAYVQRILNNGYAYTVPSGSVYFDHSKYTEYQRFAVTSDISEENGRF